MISQNQYRNSWISGMFACSPMLFFGFFLPKLFDTILNAGIKFPSNPFYTIIAIVPILLVVSPIIFASQKNRLGILTIGSYISGSLSVIVGLITQYGVDGNNFNSSLIISVLLLFSLINTILDLTLFGELRENRENGRISALFFQGMGVMLFLMGSIISFTQSEIVFYGIIGLFTILRPMGFKYGWHQEQKDDFKEKVEKSEEKAPISNIKFKIIFKFEKMSTNLILMFSIVAILIGPIVIESNSIGWSLLGAGLGLILYNLIKRLFRIPPLLLGAAGNFFLILAFYLNWKVVNNISYTICGGIVVGISLYSLLMVYGTVRDKINIEWVIRAIFNIAFSAGAGIITYRIKYFIRDNSDKFALLFVIPGLIFILMIPSVVKFFKENPRIKESYTSIANQELVTPLVSKKSQQVIKALSVIFLVTVPTIGWYLHENSGHSVHIDLSQTMYTVDGTAVSSIDLDEKTAKILSYSPNPTGIVHNETIRPGKSVRLGAYYYSHGSLSNSEVVDYIGNNLDVFSLGMCGNFIKPENITTIRTLNPNVRFYYMAFATTLFENSTHTATNGTWGSTHYATVNFNATINNWTLKLNDGTEATGVRRKDYESLNHLMDLGRHEWADYFAWIYTNRVNQYQADGVAIDEVMWKSYWDTTFEDLRDYSTLDEVVDTCYDWLERVDNQTDMEIITQAFWDDAQVYQDGIWGELAFRTARSYGGRVDDRPKTVWYESMTWEEIVRNNIKNAEQNRSIIWAAFYDPKDPTGIEYAIGTYLMSKPNNCHSLTFHPQPIIDWGYPSNKGGYSVEIMKQEVEDNADYYDLELGDALGPMFEVEIGKLKFWQRNFTNGIVYVNPNHAFVPGFGEHGPKYTPSH